MLLLLLLQLKERWGKVEIGRDGEGDGKLPLRSHILMPRRKTIEEPDGREAGRGLRRYRQCVRREPLAMRM